MQNIGGIATFEGKRIAFPTSEGFGLVMVDGKTRLFKFQCPLESMPPQGTAEPIKSGWLILRDGNLSHQGQPVVLGVVLES